MKKILLALIFINSTLCSLDSCHFETNKENCHDNEITEFNGFSCYTFKDIKKENSEYCAIFPDNANIHNEFIDFYNGMYKEWASGYYGYDPKIDKKVTEDTEFTSINKKSYSTNDIIEESEKKLPQNERELLLSKKTCTYQIYGRYMEDYNKYSGDNLSNYKGYPNITDKNICFNTEKFTEIKDKIDCGYAELKYILLGQEYKITTCFYMLDDIVQGDLRNYFKGFWVDNFFDTIDGTFNRIMWNILNYDNRENDHPELSYEMTVEGKNGRKIQYKSGSLEIKILSEGNKSEEPSTSNQLGFLRFSYILLSSLILFTL